jgi:mRNA-degrading endonuclease YafQ of YafQ-DinJ toxin-antitoxin module
MTIYESTNYTRSFKKLVKRNPDLRVAIDRKLKLLVTDRSYPGLRLHKIETSDETAWSISIDLKLRILFAYVEDGILLLDVGDHNEVY